MLSSLLRHLQRSWGGKKVSFLSPCLPRWKFLPLVHDTMTGKEHSGVIMEVTVLFLVFHHGHLSLCSISSLGANGEGKRQVFNEENSVNYCKSWHICSYCHIQSFWLLHMCDSWDGWSPIGAVSLILASPSLLISSQVPELWHLTRSNHIDWRMERWSLVTRNSFAQQVARQKVKWSEIFTSLSFSDSVLTRSTNHRVYEIS